MLNWTTACPDWEDRIVSGRSLIPFAPLFPDEAEASLSVMRDLRLVDVAGSPTIGEACRPWIMDFAGAVFGSYNPETGRRLIRNFFVTVSKKNGKSSIAGGVMLTALLRNWRPSNEYLILAPTLEVADNCFKPIKDMIEADPELVDLLHIQPTFRLVTHKETGATLKVASADGKTVAGKKAAGVLVDELWEFGKQPRADDMLREATGGLMSRPEGFVIYLSTQSDAPPAGVWKQKLEYFRGVRDGLIDDNRSLGVIYEFPERMIKNKDYLNPKNFYMTNPNLGSSVDRETLLDKFKEAKFAEEKSKGSINGFLAKHLNIEVGSRQSNDCWAGAPVWDGAVDECCRTLEEILDRSEVVTIGIDGGGLDDLLGLAVIGREKGTRRWLLWCHAWCHESALEQRKSLITIYRDLESAGELTIVQEMPEDLKQVGDLCEQVLKSGLLSCVGVDQIGLAGIVDELAERGITTEEELVVGIKQGFWLSGTIKGVERKIADGTMRHGGQALMRWCVDNAKVEPRGNAILVTKQASGTGKIDALMAMFSAAQLMALNPEPKNPQSIYDNPVAYPKRAAEPEPAPEPGWRPSAPEAQTLDWSPEILADTEHPLHADHLKRFRLWQVRNDRDYD